MKVADLVNGNLYRVRNSLLPVVKFERWDDERRLLPCPHQMMHFRGGERARYRTGDNPAMIYLGVKYLDRQLWGVRKFHWFLMDGQEVGVIGHEVRYIEPV